MSQGTIQVLLVGETEHGFSHLRKLLENRGCRCWFERSLEEAAALLDRHCFHVLLSTVPFHPRGQLLASLRESSLTAFQCCPVESGCWWLPIMRHGTECLGAPALRAGEFLGALDRVLEEIRPGRELAVQAGS